MSTGRAMRRATSRGMTFLPDAMFVENEQILATATQHHRICTPLETPFNYAAPTLTRYGRLTHDTAGLPRIELSFALLHYEKALCELRQRNRKSLAEVGLGNRRVTEDERRRRDRIQKPQVQFLGSLEDPRPSARGG